MAKPSESIQRNWRQLWLLLWKNWLLQKKKVLTTVLLVLFPIVMAAILVVIREISKPRFVSNATTYQSFLVTTNLVQLLEYPPQKVLLAYAPNTTLVARIVNRTATLLGVMIPTDLGFASESALEEYVTTNDGIFGAVVFVEGVWEILPKDISYKIRLRLDKGSSLFHRRGKAGWRTNVVFPGSDADGPREADDHFGGKDPGYYHTGFLAIQKAVDLSLVVEVNQSFGAAVMNVTTQLKRYPFPAYKEDKLIGIIGPFFPLCILFSFIIIAPTICQEIVFEKEHKFKDFMKLMGMRMWLYWLSWFIKYLLFMVISVIIITVLLHAPISRNGPVIGYGSATVTFVFLLLYSLSLITFCFAISAFVFKASYGSTITCTLFVLSYTPYIYLGTVYDDMTLAQKIGASFDFNVALGFGCNKIAQSEAVGIGVHWSNVGSSAYAEDDHTMAHILIMLSVDTIIYSMLTWCIDAVTSGNFVTPQTFSFLHAQYWRDVKGRNENQSIGDFMTLVSEDKSPYFEPPVEHAEAPIQIRGLTKNFGSKTTPAVNNLNIDFYEGNITALLGHHGAGKTTTVFLLAGFLPPSKGTAYIKGYDITRKMDEIRPELGLCPQHNILFDTLTVREHLLFFAILKGSSIKMASQDTDEMIKDLLFENAINVEANMLSAGQRRKLSVGIALISGSNFVILDEPTSGMGPKGRRQIWNILQGQRINRTMILSTNYSEEAELLGDRIAIMSSGVIQCYGTTTFLENKYDVGYHLTIVKTSTCDVNQLSGIIESQIPNFRTVSVGAKEVTFLLPNKQVSKFETLFNKLETDRKTLGIRSFAVSVMTMKEVFIRVKQSPTLEGGPRLSIAIDAVNLRNVAPMNVLYRKEAGWRYQIHQLCSMFYKRIIHSMRNYVLTLIQILIPVIFTIIACLILLDPTRDDPFPPRTLDLTNFNSPITPYDVRAPTANAQKLSAFYNTIVSRKSNPIIINYVPGNSAMDAYLIGIGKDHKDQYIWNYQIGAAIEEEPVGNLTITGLFNNQAYHSIAISLACLGNTLMQYFGNEEFQIETINHPLPKSPSEQVEDMVDQRDSGVLGFSFFVSIGLALLFATFLIFLVKERQSRAKFNQLLSGVRLYNYWLATFLWDYVCYLVPCILIVVVILVFRFDSFWQQRSWIIFIGLLLYGFSMLPFTYVMSFLFGDAFVGFIWLSVICILTGTCATAIIFVMQILTSQSTWETVEWIFCIFLPTFCFNAVLLNIYANYYNHKVCRQQQDRANPAEFCASLKQLGQSNPCCPGNCYERCLEMADDYLSWKLPGVGRPMVFMVLQGIVFFFILYIIETDFVGRLLKGTILKRMGEDTLKKVDPSEVIESDLDVFQEQERIRSTSIKELIKTHTVITQDLTNLYGDSVVVNQLSIGVSKKECFGLLGVSGAGKTTTFNMLTGMIKPSSGSAFIAGISIQDGLAKVRQRIGYCPQFDSVIDQLTVHETLWMYACAHGVPLYAMNQVIDRLINYLTLKPYTDTQAGHLSGGNKRKLCVAIALMGNPTVVFLDEPTTGVDPEARRHVWNTVAAARNAGTTIILSSHSMAECEAICNRIGILVNGRFLCLGSPEHLRDRFGNGFTLIIKLQRPATAEKDEDRQERIQKLKSFISEAFIMDVLHVHSEDCLYCHVKKRLLKWSKIFGIIEKAKVTYPIEDYSVGQTTLEQLFIGFAHVQREPQKISKKKRKNFFGLY